MKLLTGVAVVTLLALTATPARATTIAFGPTDYDNADTQTSGFFRDVLSGADIDSGGHLVGGAMTGGYTALNFTGTDTNAAYQGATTLYDLDVDDGLPTLFSGNITLSADILIDPFNNPKGAGLVFLFNEGSNAGVPYEGLALYLWNAGNTDSYAINFVHQDGVSGPPVPSGSTTAASQAFLPAVPMTGQIPEDQWFQLTLQLVFTSPTNFTATGSVFRHSDPTNPNSLPGAQVGTDLVYSNVLSSVLVSPYEVGLTGRAFNAVQGTSATNFSIDSPSIGTASAVPEPGSMLLMGSGLIGLAGALRRRMKK